MKYINRLYRCLVCGKEQKHYSWDDEVKRKKHKCTTEGCTGKLSYKELTTAPEKPAVPGIRTDTKNRV